MVKAALRQSLPALEERLCAYQHHLQAFVFGLHSVPPLKLCGRRHFAQGFVKIGLALADRFLPRYLEDSLS